MSTNATLGGISLATAVPEAEILRVRRPFTTPRHRSIEIPGRAGSLIFPDEPGDRIVELDVHLLGADVDARRASVDALLGWVYRGEVLPLVVDDQSDRYEEAIFDGASDPGEWLKTAQAVLAFRCGAYVLASASTTEPLSAATNPDSGSFTVADTVDARPVIEITPSGGGLTSFTLTVNGFALSWSRSTPVTSAITVNSIGEVVTLGVSTDVNLTGAFNTGSVSMTDVSGFFPLLVSGSNVWSFSWTGSATSVALDLEWRERFLS